jgi:ABC-type dipeptide/oligopeptide/nickel transport system permease subunit
MSEQKVISPTSSETAFRTSGTKRFLRVFFKRGVVGFGVVVLLAFIIMAAAAPVLSPSKPNAQNLRQALQGPSADHWLGTDYLGRDTLSRLIYGARMSLLVGIVAVSIAAFVGMLAGLIAGFYGSWVNMIIMRITDAMMSFPMILLALIMAGLLGGGLVNLMIALGIAMIPVYIRLMCGQVIAVKESEYIVAGKSIGSSSLRLMVLHILPNSFPPLIVLVTMQIGSAILAEAGLSYLGIGISPPTASWGSMVSEGFPYLITNPLLSFIPGMALMLIVFAFNMVGDGLRDTLDPRLKGTI